MNVEGHVKCWRTPAGQLWIDAPKGGPGGDGAGLIGYVAMPLADWMAMMELVKAVNETTGCETNMQTILHVSKAYDALGPHIRKAIESPKNKA